MKQRLLSLLLAVTLLGTALPLSGCAAEPQRYSTTWWDLFDTVTLVQGYAESQAAWDEQMTALHADLLRYNQLFDIYHTYPGLNNLATVNAGAGSGPVQVDAAILDLLTLAKTMYDTTDGKCNVAGGAVLRLWHEAREAGIASPETAALPDADALTAAAAHCDIQNLQLDAAAGTVALADPAMSLDVGSIGKGYATELAAQAARARGLQSALLNVGGNVRAIGQKPDGSAWTAGVENPWPAADGSLNTGSYVAAVELRDGECLVTSGDYQRYYTVDGVRYAHLIDPATLYPARYVSSVSVLCTDSGLADALSTGLFCMEPAAAQALVERLDGVEALWLAPDHTSERSSGFAARERLLS